MDCDLIIRFVKHYYFIKSSKLKIDFFQTKDN